MKPKDKGTGLETCYKSQTHNQMHALYKSELTSDWYETWYHWPSIACCTSTIITLDTPTVQLADIPPPENCLNHRASI